MRISHTLGSILNHYIICIYIYKLYHIHNILCLWQLRSLEFSLDIILRNEKFTKNILIFLSVKLRKLYSVSFS